MSSREMLFDAYVFLSYIGGDNLLEFSERAVNQVLDGSVTAYVSSIIYDDVVTTLYSKEMPLEKVNPCSRSHGKHTTYSLAP